jgi:hypothetical protein
MDNLHTVLRSIRSETRTRRDHLTVFREFLDHLDRVTRNRARAAREAKRGRTDGATGGHEALPRAGVCAAAARQGRRNAASPARAAHGRRNGRA